MESVFLVIVLALIEYFVFGALYAVGYMRAADKRHVGAGITGVVNMILALGALVGLVRAML
jgi:hypothetical protein